jgi:hypothetical protein
MRRAFLIACAAAALCGTAPLAAQQPLAIQPGRLRGSLGPGDATLSGGEFTDTYAITGRAGQRFIVRLSATAFDPYLLMRGPGDFSQDNDDEASGSTAARLDVRLPVDGTYRIVATSYRAGEQGDYELDLQDATGSAVAAVPSGAPAAAGGGTITLGQTARGSLASGDEAMRTGELYDTWRFQGRQGQRLVVRLAAGDFDPYLLVRGPGDFSADNDDDTSERGSKNSRLDITLPADGEYRFVATSYRPGESGAYTLSVQDAGAAATAAAAAPAPAAGAPIAVGQSVAGRIENGDPQLRSGEFLDAYALQGTRGQQLEIRLTATEFDPYVQIAGPGNYSAYNDDDVDGGTSNSRLVVTLPADGAYRIVATSFRAGESGAYRLSVGATATVTPSAGTAVSAAVLTLGRAVDGALEAGDDTLATGERVDRYAFQGRPGQRVAVDMTSRAFDSYLQLIAPSGRLEENDDAGQSTNDARLESVLTESGTYAVLATSLSRGMAGAYRLGIASLDAARSTVTTNAPSAAPGASAPVAAPAGATLALGTPQGGRLQAGDQALPSGEFVDRYAFEGRRGQVVTVDMTSTELDPYLMVVAPGGAQQENDDASTTDRNARVTWVLPADGRYTVMATTYRPGESGSYTVRFQTGAAVAARPPSGARGQRVWAVLVGISDYGSQARNLAYTADDAVKMGQALTRAGVLAEGSVVLTDADATYDRVRAAFQQVAAQAGPDDVFLFFYSGHGTQLSENAANTSEPDLRDEAIVLRDRLVTDDEMAQWFRAVRSRMAIIALDACFSGGFARDVVNRPGVMGFFSSEEDLTSAVAGKFEAGGYLSHFLRGGLSGEADADRDGSVTAGELSSYVHRMFNTQAADVAAETSERQHNYQFPVIDRGGVKIDDVVLAIAR